MPLHTGQVLQDRYHIDALLGQGGMGAVYRATDLRFNAPVAIKENRMVTPESQKQFAREAGLLYRLRHANLPRVIDHFAIGGQGQYLVMDYVEGEDLQQLILRGGPLPEAQALDWIGQVLDALDYLHARQIIHRDVKPANVKITPGGQVFLVDFGLAKVYDPLQETTIGARGVTPGFAPPEQYGQGRTDARTDVYSAAATLYTLLTGRTPPDALEYTLGQAPLLPPRQLNPGLSEAVEAAILRAMRPRPEDRFASAAELRAALPAPSSARAHREPEPAPPPDATRLAPAGRLAQIGALLPEAWAAWHRQEWDRTAALCSEVIALDSRHSEALLLLQKARTAQRLERRYADAAAALEAGDGQRALAALEEVVALDASYRDAAVLLASTRTWWQRRQELDRLWSAGQEALQQGQWQTAIASLEQLLALEPDQPEAGALLARARDEIETDRRAGEFYAQAQAGLQAQDWAAAIEAARQAAALRPETREYVELRERIGNQQQAEEKARRQAEEKARKERQRQEQLARWLKYADEAAETYPSEALEYVDRIWSESPGYPGLRQVHVRALAERDRRQQERQRQLVRRAATIGGAVAVVVVVILIVRAIHTAQLKADARHLQEAAMAAFDRGDWQSGRSQLADMVQIELKRVPLDQWQRDGLDHGINRAIEAGAWDAAASLLLERVGMDPEGQAPDWTGLLAAHPELRQALQDQTGWQILGWHKEDVSALAFSGADGSLVTLGPREVRVWHMPDGQLLHTLTETVSYNAISPSSPWGSAVVASASGSAAHLWSPGDSSLLQTLEGHTGNVYDVVFSPDGRRLASAQGDVWDVRNGKRLLELESHQVVPEGAPPPIVHGTIAFSSDSQTVAWASGPEIELWRIDGGASMPDNTLSGLPAQPQRILFSPDGSLLAYYARDETAQAGVVALRRVSDGALLQTFTGQASTRMAFSPDGTLLVTVSSDCQPQVWRLSDRALLYTLVKHQDWGLALAFSPDGELLAGLDPSGEPMVRIWRVSDGAEIATLDRPPDYFGAGLAWSANGRLLAVVANHLRMVENPGLFAYPEWSAGVVLVYRTKR
jgi:WD40 repeat protein/tetratricopeptide (TPR) repeat protein